MSSAEFTEWVAFNQLSPIGDDRGDLQAGIVASVIANVNRGTKTQSFKPKDFMPYIPAAEEKSVEKLFASAASMLTTVKRIKRNVSR